MKCHMKEESFIFEVAPHFHMAVKKYLTGVIQNYANIRLAPTCFAQIAYAKFNLVATV